jgi:hypothetical protein
MEITQIRPFPEKGQWWAHGNPLVLHQVAYPGTEITAFKMWHPLEGVTDASYVMPLGPEWSFLWFEGIVSMDYFREKPLRTGDTYWSPHSQMIFFIGPVDRKNNVVTILSDIQIPIGPDFTRLTRGPIDVNTESPTAYDRILKEE